MKKKVVIITLILIVIVALSILIYNLFFKPIIIIGDDNISLQSKQEGAQGGLVPQVMPTYIKIDKGGRKYQGYSEKEMEIVKKFDTETMKTLNEKLSSLCDEIKDARTNKGFVTSNCIIINGKMSKVNEFNEKAKSIYTEILMMIKE